MNYTLPGIRKIYISPISGDTIDYHYSSTGKVVINETMSFNLKEVENVGFTQSKTVDARGSYFQKQFDFVVANVADTIIEDFENQSLVILFEDNNSNYWITGHKKPYSLDKEDFKINDDNSIEFSISQVYQDKIEPIVKNWIDSSDITFPVGGEFNIPDDFMGVTGGSIHLSWTNKVYTVDYDGFNLIRTNPVGHPSGSTQSFYVAGESTTGFTQSPDYYFGGNYQYKIALSNEGDTYLYSNTINVNAPNPNRILNLSSAVDDNDIVLSWTNRTYKVPYQGYKIERTNPVGHPSGATTYFNLNLSGQTSFRDVNVGNFSDLEDLGTYKYKIAISSLNGVNPNQYSNETTSIISNYNVPFDVVASVSGNSIVLVWSNPAYSITVQSFAINRLRLVGGLWVDGTLLTYNNDGSSSTFTDTNIGAEYTNATYKYQIAVATGLDGFGRQTFSEYSNNIEIYNTNVDPAFSLNTAMNTTVYYGASRIQPVLTVSGGTGTLDVDYNWDIGGSNHDEVQSVTANGTIFNQNLPYRYTVRGDVFNISLQANPSIYSLYGTTSRTYTSPSVSGSGKVEGISVSQVGANVHLSWTAYVDSSAGVKYGYVISKYPTADFSSLTRIIVSGTGTTSYIDGSPATGNYTYFIQAISIVDAFSQPNPSIYLSPAYPDFFPITIT